MNHPPETGLTSRELAEHIFQSQAPGPEIKWGHCWCCDATLTRVTALIEAWVRVREANVRLLEHTSFCACGAYKDNHLGCARYHFLESALATARKQQETL